MFDTEIEGWLPDAVDTLEPGPALAALLAATDVTELSGHDRVRVLNAHRRMASHYQAETYRDMVAITAACEDLDLDRIGATPADTPDMAAAEIRTALVLTRRAADIELAFALELKRGLPKVWNRFAAGQLDLARVRVIVAGLSHLPEHRARRVADYVLDDAPGLTTGQLAARIRKRCIEADPDDADRRYRRTVEQRAVVSYPTPDGAANLLGSDLPPQRVAAVMERINRIARSLHGSDEVRTMDQLRADVFLDLLEGTAAVSKAPRGVVDIHVDLTTLAELDQSSAELAGYGPVVADIAKRVARQRAAEWRFTVTDPATGDLYTGVTRRRPTARQRRAVEARYRTCVFPGCRMPASDCDLDHRIPYSQGGATHPTNLAPCCRHDHLNQRHRGWDYRRLHNGDHHWTSPLGHTYTTRSPPG